LNEPAKGMTDRVSTAVHQMEESHEILICWIQGALLSLLGLLYFAAPKGFSNRPGLEPVPMVLAIYAPILALRLWLAYRRKLTPVWLYLSILADTSLVTFLIWSFHVQYGRSLAFSLKAPTFVYYFLFLSLRCLRYEAKYVLAAGLASMAAWTILLTSAIRAGGSVTHSFTDYVLGENILIGAEIDKILLLALVTGVLAYSVRRSRQLLERAVSEAQKRAQLTRFFSPQVADSILDGPQAHQPGQGKLTEGAFLSIDMRGFSKLSTTASPEEVIAILNEYHERMVGVIFENRGSVDKYMGDGILAHFGVADSNPTYAADLLRTIEGMVDAGNEWNRKRAAEGKPALGFGFAGATGKVIFGAIGNQEKLELTVIGEAVNLASKLEKHTKKVGSPGLVTRATFDLAVAQGFQAKGPVWQMSPQDVDGFPEPVALVGLCADTSVLVAA
jgi:adenylate cyclase